jgi:hypothetical protein
MSTLARNLFLQSDLRVEQELPGAGTPLENPFVYDAVAREFKQMARAGLVEIVEERARAINSDRLIDSLRYRRMRLG